MAGKRVWLSPSIHDWRLFQSSNLPLVEGTFSRPTPNCADDQVASFQRFLQFSSCVFPAASPCVGLENVRKFGLDSLRQFFGLESINISRSQHMSTCVRKAQSLWIY